MRSSVYLNTELPHTLVSEDPPLLARCIFSPVFPEEISASWGTPRLLGATVPPAPVCTDN